MRRILYLTAAIVGMPAAGLLLAALTDTILPGWRARGQFVLGGFLVALIVVVGVDEAVGHSLQRAVRNRLWPALKRLTSSDQPVRGRRLPLAVGLPILLLLILVVLVVAIVTRDAAWTAGTAAITTMIVLAYQGWQIQESTAVSAQAVVIGQAAAIEAEKRRLDNKAPRIRVSIDPPNWPPTGGRLYASAEPTQLADGHVFRLPKNAGDPIGLWAEGRVQNEGAQTVTVELRGVRLIVELPGVTQDTPGRSPWSEPGTWRRSLAPGETICFRLQGECSVSDWKANYRADEHNRRADMTKGELPMALIVAAGAEVEVDDEDDNGVIDTWSLGLSGCPLEPVPDEGESWRVPSVLADRAPVSSTRTKRRRSYWRSKARRLELTTPEV